MVVRAGNPEAPFAGVIGSIRGRRVSLLQVNGGVRASSLTSRFEAPIEDSVLPGDEPRFLKLCAILSGSSL